MAIEVDMKDVEAWKGGEILPPGRHLVEVSSVDDSKTSSGGYPQLELEFRAIGGDHDGGTLMDWLVVIPSTFGKVKSLLESAGIKVPNGNLKIPAGELVGKRLFIIVREEFYKGEKTRVRAYQPAAESDIPADTTGLPQNGAPKQGDDDIPF